MFDRVIVSCDDSHFKEFWPIVSKAWNNYFPDKKVTLAFVTDREDDDPLVQKMKNYGDVYLFPLVDGIPTANLAKMSRHILACNFNDEVCMIEDIDTIPLQVDFINRILSQREPNKILFVGSEVYNGEGSDEGKFPISNMTGESYLFKRLINPFNLSVEDLFNSWRNIRIFDNKESINNDPDTSGSGSLVRRPGGRPVIKHGFSDESLLRVLISKNDPNKDMPCFIRRDVDIRKYWIDRSWWEIDINMLKNDQYVICNFLRPFSQNYHLIEPIVKYIFRDDNIKMKDVIL
jgi:hypothetical protein